MRNAIVQLLALLLQLMLQLHLETVHVVDVFVCVFESMWERERE